MEDGKSITLSDDETAKLKALVELYSRNAKPYILYSEQIDPDSKSNLQVIKEQRDALDHLMRFFSEKFDNSSAINGDYCLTHLSKSKGHLYRAAFDALDGATLSLKLKISQIVNNYSLEVILAVIKNYGEIKLKLEKLNERIASYRNSKDIGDDKSLELMESYASDIDEMKEYYATILGLEKDLHKLNTDKANNEKSNKSVCEKALNELYYPYELISINCLIRKHSYERKKSIPKRPDRQAMETYRTANPPSQKRRQAEKCEHAGDH